MVELILVDLAAEGIAVNAEHLRGTGLIPIGTVEDALNESFFEFADGLVEEDAAFHHLNDEPFQLIFHDRTLHWKKLLR
jgi:hypothetical protein